MKRNRFPSGWDETRVRRLLDIYERQTEDEAVAEDEAGFELRGQTVMVVPNRLVPEITRLIAKQQSGTPGLPRSTSTSQAKSRKARRA